jgi:hypothetical protein
MAEPSVQTATDVAPEVEKTTEEVPKEVEEVTPAEVAEPKVEGTKSYNTSYFSRIFIYIFSFPIGVVNSFSVQKSFHFYRPSW